MQFIFRITPFLARTVLLLMVVGVGTGVSFWLRGEHSAPPSSILRISIGAVALDVPADLVPASDLRRDGLRDTLTLVVKFPTMTAIAPLHVPEIDTIRHGSPLLQDEHILLILRAQDHSVAPADRVVQLYSRFLDREAPLSDVAGLQKQAFETGSPYEGESVYFSPPEGRAFTARCPNEQAGTHQIPERCMSEFRLQGLDVQMRFAPALLSEWQELAARVQALITRIVQTQMP